MLRDNQLLTPAWSFLALPLFCMPAYLPVTPATVNYAPVVFVAFVSIASIWYFVWGRKNYAGPPREEVHDVDVAVRRASQAQFEKGQK